MLDDELAADFRALGVDVTADAVAEIEVWSTEWDAVSTFHALTNQWTWVGTAGAAFRVGLRLEAAEVFMRAAGIAPGDVIDSLLVLEAEALAALAAAEG